MLFDKYTAIHYSFEVSINSLIKTDMYSRCVEMNFNQY